MTTESASLLSDPPRERRNIARAVMAGLLALQLLFVVGGLAKAKESPSLRPPRFNRIAAAQDALPITPESGLPLAQQYAEQWKTGARLVAVSMHLDWPDETQTDTTTELPQNGFLLYVFVAGNRAITINLDRGSGNLNDAVVSDQGGSVWKSLDISAFATSSTIAGITADLVAGRAYRNACADLRHESDIAAGFLAGTDGSVEPIWSIVYQQERHNDVVDVRVRLDAANGTVIDKSVTNRGCDE